MSVTHDKSNAAECRVAHAAAADCNSRPRQRDRRRPSLSSGLVWRVCATGVLPVILTHLLFLLQKCLGLSSRIHRRALEPALAPLERDHCTPPSPLWFRWNQFSYRVDVRMCECASAWLCVQLYYGTGSCVYLLLGTMDSFAVRGTAICAPTCMWPRRVLHDISKIDFRHTRGAYFIIQTTSHAVASMVASQSGRPAASGQVPPHTAAEGARGVRSWRAKRARGASAPQPLASRTAWGASAAWGTGRLVGSLVRILPAASWRASQLPAASPAIYQFAGHPTAGVAVLAAACSAGELLRSHVR